MTCADPGGACRTNTNVEKGTISMALANHETLFDIGVDAAVSETSLHKVPND